MIHLGPRIDVWVFLQKAIKFASRVTSAALESYGAVSREGACPENYQDCVKRGARRLELGSLRMIVREVRSRRNEKWLK